MAIKGKKRGERRRKSRKEEYVKGGNVVGATHTRNKRREEKQKKNKKNKKPQTIFLAFGCPPFSSNNFSFLLLHVRSMRPNEVVLLLPF